MGRKLEDFDWGFLSNQDNDKMQKFHETLFSMFEESFPLKQKIILNENEPFITDALLKMRRKKSREYNKFKVFGT